VIPKVVDEEFTTKLWDALADVFRKAEITKHRAVIPFLMRAKEVFDKKLKKDARIHSPMMSTINKVRSFYRKIWLNPSLEHKRQAWARLKRKEVDDGPPSGADLEILATAVELTDGDVELLTLDNDFLVFKDEIRDRFKLIVTDASAL